jgi:hypothetical protein
VGFVMHAIIDGNGDCLYIVHSTDGYDLTGLAVVAVPDPARDYAWDKATQTFVPRPLTPAEETAAAMEADPRWQAMKTATPAQIEAWLTANTTTLAEVRRVLKILILAVQMLARTRT